MVQTQGCRFRQVIKQRRGVVKEQRQVIFNAGRRDALAYILVDAGFGRVAFEAFAEILAEF